MWDKTVEDDVFFMAGAIAFNLLVAVVPLVILAIGVAGYVLSARVGDPTEAVLSLVAQILPEPAEAMDLTILVRGPVETIVELRSDFTLVGAAFFIWLATRLVGSLRIALRDIFDVGQARSVLAGKLFDIQAVMVGTILLVLNIGITVVLEAVMDYGVGILGLEAGTIGRASRMVGYTVAFLSIWVLFLGVYRFLPARRIPWRTVTVAATFSAVFHEVLKLGFSWYTTDVADYGSTFGNLSAVVALIFWIYYGAVVFILGGEIAQVYTMRKAGRVGVRMGIEGRS
ncbi:MAG: YihY/virulence factor BrkB family protein [Gemmatimonadota bacterium]|nr:YihY/virulence factor BrkB family protein [Gemmatimonadota bacterium]MDH5759637.1 YihY/virulence factor BrkB family protein [Gemmatimonadota bacterium]